MGDVDALSPGKDGRKIARAMEYTQDHGRCDCRVVDDHIRIAGQRDKPERLGRDVGTQNTAMRMVADAISRSFDGVAQAAGGLTIVLGYPSRCRLKIAPSPSRQDCRHALSPSMMASIEAKTSSIVK